MLNLQFTDARRPLAAESRKKTGREVILEAIQHQIGLLNDPGYKVERMRYAKDDDGKHIRKTITAPPKPWWWKTADGTMLIQIRYGHANMVEIESGKPTIVCGKTEMDVIAVLEQVVEALRAGMLDTQIDAAKGKVRRHQKAA